MNSTDPGVRPVGLRGRFPGVRLVFADALAEGGWVAVLGSGVEVGLTRPAQLTGVAPFLVAALVGVLAAPFLSVERRRLFAARVALGLAVAAAWLLVGLAAGSNVSPLQVAPWMLALAAIRGAGRATSAWPVESRANLLARLGPALAIPWLVGWIGPGREALVMSAGIGTACFVGGSLASIALARLDEIRVVAGDAWDGDRSWGRVIAAAVGGVVLAALLVAVVASVPGQVLHPAIPAAPTQAPLPGNLTIDGSGSRPPDPGDQGIVPGAARRAASTSGTELVIFICAVMLVLVLLAAAVARSRRRRQRPAVDSPTIERRFEPPKVTFRLPGLPRWRRTRTPSERPPRTAADAYRAARRDLDVVPSVAAAGGETPREHARRVAPVVGRPLALLAADLERELYAGREVSAPETRRAMRRLATLRSALRRTVRPK